jgi:hypothetical protein
MASGKNKISHVKQKRDDSCAIAAGSMVVSALGAQAITEEALKSIAEKEGWYASGFGTLREFMYSLIETQGVHARYEYASGLDDLRRLLRRGHLIVIDVEARLWFGQKDIPEACGHAVVVTQATRDPDGKWRILVHDPVCEEEEPLAVSVETFAEAWARRGYFMVVAEPRGA